MFIWRWCGSVFCRGLKRSRSAGAVALAVDRVEIVSCAETTGAMAKALETTLDYLKAFPSTPLEESVGIICQSLHRGIKMPTRNVVLTEYQASVVEQLVKSGHYQNASEVLRDGLRLLEQREAEDSARLEALRTAVSIGVADFDLGRFSSFDTSSALKAHLAALANKANAAP